MQQNEIARQYAVSEIENAKDWRQNELEWMMKLFPKSQREDREYKALESMSKYPHRIMAGWTWNRVFSGLLTNAVIQSQLINFYESDYPEFIEELNKDKHGSQTPIWVVIRPKEGELEKNKVYPLITRFHGHSRHIVLAINE